MHKISTSIGANPYHNLFFGNGNKGIGIVNNNNKQAPNPVDTTGERPSKTRFDFLNKGPIIIFREKDKKFKALQGTVTEALINEDGTPKRITLNVDYYHTNKNIKTMILSYCQIKGKGQYGWVQTEINEGGKIVKHFELKTFIIKDWHIKKKAA